MVILDFFAINGNDVSGFKKRKKGEEKKGEKDVSGFRMQKAAFVFQLCMAHPLYCLAGYFRL